jgi:hypothetical protein
MMISLKLIKRKLSAVIFSAVIFLLLSCAQTSRPDDPVTPRFDRAKAEYLYTFAYDCIDREYPNKPGTVLGDDSYLMPPRELHPAFYGCFDWHSAVHGHWTLTTILSRHPDFALRDSIIAKLAANITRENIAKEIKLFEDEHNRTFQRTYGWAWLLKLDDALRSWDDPAAAELHSYLAPLSDLLAARFVEFLDLLNHPIRVGEHPNTAFGMSFAYDWAVKYHPVLAEKIREKAREYFMADRNCPLDWEPGGWDFLSPCLEQAALMLKVLPRDEYSKWLQGFMPGFERNPAKYLTPAVVTDPTDGKLAHLDGLNFSRAWRLFEIGHALDNPDMIRLGVEHFNFSYGKLDSGEYMGSHWLASFAAYALLKAEN